MSQKYAYGRYWIWKNPSVGAKEDNYQTVSGREFFNIMRDPTQERYCIRLTGETPEETLYMETSKEEYQRWAAERGRAHYVARDWQNAGMLSLDLPMSTGEEGGTIIGLLQEDDDIWREQEEAQFARFMMGLLSGWSEQDRFIAAARFLAEEPLLIREIAAALGINRGTAYKRIEKVRKRLILAMEKYDPGMTNYYTRGLNHPRTTYPV